MSSLLNKLTGHHDKTDATKTHHDNNLNNNNTHTSTTTSHNPLNNTTTRTEQTVTTNTSPYGVTGTLNNASSNMSAAQTSATATTNNSGYSHQGVANTTSGYAQHGHTDAAYSQRVGNLSGDDAITRSEEQLRVAKERVETGKAELNKYVTTEHVETAVPVQKERVVIEREPITEANRAKALSGPAISEAHYETTIAEDRVRAEKEVVPIERIRLAKQVETTTQNVGADLRKEHVDFTHSKLTNDVNTLNQHNTNNAGVPHTKY